MFKNQSRTPKAHKKPVAKHAKRALATKPTAAPKKSPLAQTSRSICSVNPSKSLTQTKLNGYAPERASLTGAATVPAFLQSHNITPKPSLLTQSIAFAPTSKKWNKKRSQSAVNKRERAWIRQRYHGSNYMDPYPVMTMAKFVRLPRPLFIESETIDLFLPAPQVEHLATPQSFSASAQAAQQPY